MNEKPERRFLEGRWRWFLAEIIGRTAPIELARFLVESILAACVTVYLMDVAAFSLEWISGAPTSHPAEIIRQIEKAAGIVAFSVYMFVHVSKYIASLAQDLIEHVRSLLKDISDEDKRQ